MGILYKYMSYRDGFFIKPSLRATQRKSLNDPFEILPQASQVANLYSRIASVAQESGQSSEGLAKIGLAISNSDEALYRYTSLMDRYGIISLASNRDSILMWSHYAEDHRGICIGIDTDCLGGMNNLQHSSRGSGKTGMVQPVIYSRQRAVNDSGDLSFNYLFDSFFVKSEVWEYEGEHRVVVELENSDEVLISRSGVEIIRKMGFEENFSLVPLGNGKFKVLFEGVEMKEGDKGFYGNIEVKSRSVKGNMLSALAEDPSTVFLCSIPKTAIREIVFGCQASSQMIKEVLSDVKSWHHFIEVFRSVKSHENFEVSIEPYK